MRRLNDDLLLDDLDLSGKALRLLRWVGCKTVGDVRQLGKQAAIRVPGLGRRTINEIAEVIGGWGSPEIPEVVPEPVDLGQLVGASPQKLLEAIIDVAEAMIRCAYDLGRNSRGEPDAD